MLYLLTSALAMATPATAEVEVRVGYTEQTGCSAIIGGKEYRLPEEREALDAALKAVAEKAKHVALLGDSETPYRCIGALIYVLQVNGATKVEFKTLDR
ncbi:hypothetical protein M9978_06410 [Sphingomonas sp. MG17]|uniref:Uncharacterized protein n=1 Tax=Sphingomonas tagetis TaxID=2949092 RepID=A0A9X2HFW3_9SPHN|nr:hypothetical protein [Sphingomonas tagetis]MCP3730058.1 hypothetical protein [Sphingomonas tagetis]